MTIAPDQSGPCIELERSLPSEMAAISPFVDKLYRWRQLWNELAGFYDLPIAEPLAMSIVSEMSEKAPLWDSMVARYGLHATPYNQIANWAFVDWMLTHQSFRRQLTRLRNMRIIP
jgi:hypothetical protein